MTGRFESRAVAMDTTPEQSARSFAGNVADGLAAGFAGTAAMSLSQTVEIALTGRKPSTTPAEAVCVLLGIETRTEAQEQRFAREAHWAYGTIWGLGQLPLRRIAKPARTILYVAAVWTAGAALITGLRLAPPPNKWSRGSLLADLMHHLIYAGAASLTFAALERRRYPQLL